MPEHLDAPGRVLVIMPTYDERESLPASVEALRAHVPAADLLVVDDASPDGTGTLAEELAVADERARGRRAVHVLHRAGKEGLGPAYLDGFRWGLQRGYDALVEMDADGSHRAVDLPRLIAALADADLVIGSRWVPGGRVVDWSVPRQALSRGGNTYARVMLGLPLRDATAGFRAYRASTLRTLDLGRVESHGYCFQIDMARRVVGAGLVATEVPITFVERAHGSSKMSSHIVAEALVKVTGWAVEDRWGRTTRSRRPH